MLCTHNECSWIKVVHFHVHSRNTWCMCMCECVWVWVCVRHACVCVRVSVYVHVCLHMCECVWVCASCMCVRVIHLHVVDLYSMEWAFVPIDLFCYCDHNIMQVISNWGDVMYIHCKWEYIFLLCISNVHVHECMYSVYALVWCRGHLFGVV